MSALPGARWFRNALDETALESLERVAAHDGAPGVRLALTAERRAALAPVDRAVRTLLPAAHPVRLVGFSKQDGTNWQVPWHQDRIVATAGRADLAGFANWSLKGDTWHCEPPRAVLDAMLFVRLHLDDSKAEDGAMEYASGSHALGPVAAADAASLARNYPCETGAPRRGDILVLPMLTLHRSRPSRTGRPRRALRIDYAAKPLPAPLRWAEAH